MYLVLTCTSKQIWTPLKLNKPHHHWNILDNFHYNVLCTFSTMTKNINYTIKLLKSTKSMNWTLILHLHIRQSNLYLKKKCRRSPQMKLWHTKQFVQLLELEELPHQTLYHSLGTLYQISHFIASTSVNFFFMAFNRLCGIRVSRNPVSIYLVIVTATNVICLPQSLTSVKKSALFSLHNYS